MNKGIQFGLAASKLLRLAIAIIPLIVAGRGFNANAQTVTILHSFGSVLNDAADPETGLVQGNDGNFYGTTELGGTNNDGTVFRITSQGTLTFLWQFNGTNGKNPSAGLVQGNDGNFYGTTDHGGTNSDGTVFRITTNGTLTTLWQFGSDPTNGKNLTSRSGAGHRWQFLWYD